MMPGQALLRLMWRPATLLMLAMLAMAAVLLPLVVLANSAADPLRVLFTDMPAARAALWRLAVMAPAALGLLVGVFRLELEGFALGRALPGGRLHLLSGTLLFAAVSMLGVFALMSRALPLPESGAAAALAAVWLSVSLLVLHPATPRALRWLLVGGMVALVIAPAPLFRGVEAAPVLFLVAGGALAGAAWLALHRARHEGDWEMPWFLERAMLPLGRMANETWTVPLSDARLSRWLSAAAYETGTSFPGTHMRVAAWAAIISHVMQMPVLLTIGVMGYLSDSGMKLSGDLLHPVSRPERARIAFRGSVVDAVTVHVLLAVAMLLLATAGVPAIGWFTEDMKPISLAAVLGFGVALAPLAQFQGICRHARSRSEQPGIAYYASAFLYIMSTIIAASVVTRMELPARPLVLAGVIVVTAVTTHGIHRFLLREFFATSDLARAGRS
jgi:hypothetical protein